MRSADFSYGLNPEELAILTRGASLAFCGSRSLFSISYKLWGWRFRPADGIRGAHAATRLHNGSQRIRLVLNSVSAVLSAGATLSSSMSGLPVSGLHATATASQVYVSFAASIDEQ